MSIEIEILYIVMTLIWYLISNRFNIRILFFRMRVATSEQIYGNPRVYVFLTYVSISSNLLEKISMLLTKNCVVLVWNVRTIMDRNKRNVISPCKHLLWHPPLLSWHLFIDIRILDDVKILFWTQNINLSKNSLSDLPWRPRFHQMVLSFLKVEISDSGFRNCIWFLKLD